MNTSFQHFRVAIIGTGFSGLGMAIKLKQAGQNDFIILERSENVGGTWHDNTYPGCACDIPSHLYSFSFALKPDWSRVFSAQPEIWAYLRHCVEHYGLIPHIRWRCSLQAAVWDEATEQWHITTPQGLITAQFLILGNGPLSEPTLPNIPGLADFQGTLFHSAQWNHSHNLTGERIAVIGTGASAIQFVPKIQPKAGQILLFQRTPPWIFPRFDHPIPAWQRTLYRWFPPAQRLVRAQMYWLREFRAIGLLHYQAERSRKIEQLALKYLEHQVSDPTLRAKLTPNYALGCKRILLSDDFYPAVAQPNVQLVTEKIQEIRPHSIVSDDGTEHQVDTIICGTGFRASDAPVGYLVRGRNGQLLADAWRDTPQAYLGSTVAGYPNMFLMIGPNTGLGHNSMVHMIESQITYILDALRTMQRQQVQTIEVRPAIQAKYNEQVQKRLQGTVWNSGCKSWYLNKQGRNTTLWPGFTFSFRLLTRRFNPTVYSLTPQKAQKVTVGTGAP